MANSFTIAGNLTRDVEVREVGEQFVVKFSIADNCLVRKNGESVEVPLYQNVEYWTKNVKFFSTWKKGEMVVAVGQLVPNDYEKNGETIKTLLLRATQIQLLSKRPKVDKAGETEDIKGPKEDDVPF